MELAFCPGQAPFVEIFGAASAADHSADASAAGAHHQSGDQSGGSHHRGGRIDPPCPFAVAALAAAIGVPHLDAASLRTVDRVVPDQTVSVPLAGLERVERIRGPPSLS